MQKKPEPGKLDSTAPKIEVLPQPILNPDEMAQLRQDSQAAMKHFREVFKRRREQQEH